MLDFSGWLRVKYTLHTLCWTSSIMGCTNQNISQLDSYSSKSLGHWQSIYIDNIINIITVFMEGQMDEGNIILQVIISGPTEYPSYCDFCLSNIWYIVPGLWNIRPRLTDCSTVYWICLSYNALGVKQYYWIAPCYINCPLFIFLKHIWCTKIIIVFFLLLVYLIH